MSIGRQEYRAALKAAEGQCQCRHDRPGSCRGQHRHTGPSCYAHADDPEGPLLLAALDPDTTDRDAARLSVAGLLVLCRACWTRRRIRADDAREARAEAALTAAQLALDLDL
ncbi:hypothetical protein [Streptomyces goshikiensis]|uniref:hypothetical protein n=1 Tax=Streptomyces goshikiensis TaxID=1942 RepID=UPI003817E26A